MKLNINNVRLAFPSIFEPSAFEDGAPMYGAKFVVDPADTALVAKLDDAMLAVAKEKWKDKGAAIFDRMTKTGKPKGIEVPFVHEPYGKDGEPYDGFEGMYYITAKSATRPLVIDRDKSPLVAADGRPYAGCFVNIQIELWPQDHPKWGKAIRAQLKGIQFFKDGDAFAGGAPANADDFEELGVEAELA